VIQMKMLAVLLTAEHWGDVGYWIVFFMGTCVWLLVCAGAALRSKHNPLRSRWAYVQMNWDIFLIRQIPDLIVFNIWRHVSLNDILAMIHIPWQWAFNGSSGFVGALTTGFAADALIAYGLKTKYVPDVVRQWVQERIPELPADKPDGASPTP
jgi:hypothetical protein